MSKGNLGQVVKRAISDAAFRRQLQSDPEGALKGFDLSSDERAALRSGDASKLTSLGIDQRMSKTFAMGEGAAAVSKWGTGNDLALGATVPDGGEPLVSDALISGAGGRASDALIGEASGAKGARISDAGGSVRSTVTDGERLGQVNAAFEGGDRAAGRSALGDQHDIARAAIGDSTASGVRNALGDQHDGGRSAIGGEADRLAQVNAAFEGSDSAPGGRALGDQHDVARATVGDSTASAGRNALGDQHDVARGTVGDSTASVGRNALGDQHDGGRAAIGGTPDYGQQTSLNVSGSTRGVSARIDTASSEQSSLDVAGQTRGDAFITSDEAGRDVAARGAQDYGNQSSLDVSGNTRDASVISGDTAGRQGDAFLTADEMGNDVTASVRAPDPDTALTQREALANDAAIANPEGYTKPDVDA